MRRLGDPASPQLADAVGRVRGVVGDEWEKTAEIRDALGEPLPAPRQVRYALATLAERGEIKRDPPITEGSGQGQTLRWRLKRKSDGTQPNLAS